MITRPSASFLFALPFLVAVVGCDSATGLDEVSLVGTWDGVGSLQTNDAGRDLHLFIQSHTGGALTGTWTRTDGASYLGNITGGSVESGEIHFTLESYPGDDPSFAGRLTDQHRMSGSLDGIDLSGTAVFRRSSVDPS